MNIDIKEIINLYMSGLSLKMIGKQFNCSGEKIRLLLNKHDIKRRDYNQLNRKHQLNENLFDIIDSQEKAYFLGLLFADGNVHSVSNSIVLKLKDVDREILEKLSLLIYNKILLYKSLNNYALKFSSFHIKDQLIKYGCIPNKTFKIMFPTINEDLHNHFIRGYFDGDGSIYSYNKNYGMNIVSTEKFCNTVNNIIYNNTGIDGTISKDKKMLERGNSITSILKYSGNLRVKSVLNWIYKDAFIFLDRKHKRYIEINSIG